MTPLLMEVGSMTDLSPAAHPITPPPELVQQWMTEAHDQPPGPDARVIATMAARWGADTELEACCLLLDSGEHAATYGCHDGTSLRAARRPRPPSLKEQALALVSRRIGDGFLQMLTDADAEIIRQALEALPND